MWALKIKAREKWGFYNQKTKECNVKVFFFSQNNYTGYVEFMCF